MDYNTALTLPKDCDIREFAGQITSEILDKCERNLLYRITKNEFPYTPEGDRNEIFNIALKHASGQSDDVMDTIHYNRRKALIEERAIDYLRENNCIILNGFINFRLEEYKNELRGLCHDAADEMYALREYDEFINMLRFFVSVQSPKENTVHVLKKNGVLRIENKWHRDITKFYAEEFAFSGEDFTPEDIALSALISISPRKIVVHDNKENDKIYETLLSVFPNVEFTI